MNTGAQLRDEGIDLVLLHTSAMWRAKAIGLYRTYMTAHPHGFTAEDCKVYARQCGLGEPHHVNCWGAIWSGLVKTRAITKTGRWLKSELPSRHANEVPEWKITERF
jgi:hypothetical protein